MSRDTLFHHGIMFCGGYAIVWSALTLAGIPELIPMISGIVGGIGVVAFTATT